MCQVNSAPNVIAVHFGKKMTATMNVANVVINSKFQPMMEKAGKGNDAQFADVLHFLTGNVGIVAHEVNNKKGQYRANDKKTNFTEEDARSVFTDIGRQIEAKTVLEDKDKVEELLKKVIRSLDNIPLVGKFFADVPTLCLILKDYIEGDYTAIPVASLVTIVIALIYFVSPVDLVPDFIPVLGKMDDALVITVAVGAIHNDIADYKEWKGLDSSKVNDPHNIFG